MKKVILYDDIREMDFKPNELLNTYMQITKKDVKEYFAKAGGLEDCDCPACRAKRGKASFSKFGFDYFECANCGTMYVSPRPTDEAIDGYYKNSSASKYWKKTLSKSTEFKRKEKINRPRMQWVVDTVQEYLKGAKNYLDINTNDKLAVDEIAVMGLFEEKTVVNPRFGEIGDYGDSVKIITKGVKHIAGEGTADVISLFEVMDRTSDIDSLLGSVSRMLKPNGLCFITTLSISGFDLQILREESNSIFPPDRINVFSLEGINLLFKKYGFECIELSTPGLLDVEIVATALKKNPSLKLSAFIKYLITKRDMDAHKAFQEFLQMNQLSSYVRAVFKKLGK